MFAAIKAKALSLYHTIADHLTKLLGLIGLAVSLIDPQAVQGAASAYLGAGAQRKIGVGLFALVIARGWYTGFKAKQNATPPAA